MTQEETIEKHIKNYNSFPWFDTPRKQSAIMFIGYYLCLAIYMFFIGEVDDMVIIAIIFKMIVVSPIAMFAYAGKRWAMITAIVFFSFELISVMGLEGFSRSFILSLVAYCGFTIHRLSLASKIEKKRRLN